MLKILEPDFKHTDERGSLIQLVHKGFNQVNVISSEKNSQRGGHYHKINKEAFFIISGSLLLNLQSHTKKESYQFHQGDMFLIEPYVFHEFSFPEETLLVSLYDKGVELPEGRKDIYTTYNSDEYSQQDLKKSLQDLIHEPCSFTDYRYIEWKYRMVQYLSDRGDYPLIEKLEDILAGEIIIDTSKLTEHETIKHFQKKMELVYKTLFLPDE